MMKKSNRFTDNTWLFATLIIVSFLLFIKIGLFVVGDLANNMSFFCGKCHDTNVLWSQNIVRGTNSVWQTWDAQNYLYLAEHWYTPNHKSIAFYPLLPILIRVGWFIFGTSFWSAQLIATFLSIAAAIGLYSAMRILTSHTIALWSTLLYITFPTAFFLHLIYTESLFILLVSCVIISVKKQYPIGTALASCLLVLTRSHGTIALCGIIIASLFWEYANTQRPRYNTHWRITLLALIIGSLTGAVLYFYNMFLFTGSPTAGFAIQKEFGSQFSWLYVLHPIRWIQDALLSDGLFMSINKSIISRALLYVSFIGSIFVWKSRSMKPFFPMVIGLILFSALPGTLASYTRYALALFPIFPAIVERAIDTPNQSQKIIGYGIIIAFGIISLILQLLLFFYHANNLWIG